MNKVFLIGRTATDPNIVITKTGKKLATFKLAVHREFKNAEGIRETDFLRIAAWEGKADVVERNLTKGRLICVEGSIQVSTYPGSDNTARVSYEINCKGIEFLDPNPFKNTNQNHVPIKDLPTKEPAIPPTVPPINPSDK